MNTPYTLMHKTARIVLYVFIVRFALTLCLSFLTGIDQVSVWSPWSFDITRSKLFVDSVHVSMAHKAITDTLSYDVRVQQWPQWLQNFLNNNGYVNSNGEPVFHLPPFSSIQYTLGAWCIVHINIWSMIVLHTTTVFMGMYAVTRHSIFNNQSRMSAFGLLALSYPAIYMWYTGNFISALTTLGLCIYVFSVFTGRNTYLGYAGLICAINMRPNVVIFVLLEFMREKPKHAWLRILCIGITTICVAAVSYMLMHNIDARYTLQNLQQGLNAYYRVMILDNGAAETNHSLYGVWQLICSWSTWFTPKTVTTSLLTQKSVLSAGVTISGIICLALLASVAWGIFKKRFSFIEATFLLCAMNTLYTPAYATYHMLTFAIVLIVFGVMWQHADVPVRTKCIVWAFLLASALGLTSILSLSAMIAAFIGVAIMMIVFATQHSSTEAVIYLSSILALCPILPTALHSVILLCSVCIILFKCHTRSAPTLT